MTYLVGDYILSGGEVSRCSQSERKPLMAMFALGHLPGGKLQKSASSYRNLSANKTRFPTNEIRYP